MVSQTRVFTFPIFQEGYRCEIEIMFWLGETSKFIGLSPHFQLPVHLYIAVGCCGRNDGEHSYGVSHKTCENQPCFHEEKAGFCRERHLSWDFFREASDQQSTDD